MEDGLVSTEAWTNAALGGEGAGGLGPVASVSVALGTYNGEKFLQAQLASLAAQTHRPFELVACDDGSSDDTLKILARFAEAAPFPVHIHTNSARLGYRDNFLQAARRCGGRYVAFCDQDDVWAPTKLEQSVGALETTGALLCTHSVRLIDAAGSDLGFASQGIDATRVAPSLSLAPWGIFRGFTMTFPRRLLDMATYEHRPEDHHAPGQVAAHDQWVYFLATSLGKTALIFEPLAGYRQHGGNVYGLTGGSSRTSIGDRFRARPITLRRHAEICRARAQVMAEVGRRDPNLQPDAVDAQNFWRDLGATYTSSAQIYSERRIWRRMALLGRLLAQGAYSVGVDEGLGVHGLASDLMALVAAGRGLRAA